jgi:hypothetical protein
VNAPPAGAPHALPAPSNLLPLLLDPLGVFVIDLHQIGAAAGLEQLVELGVSRLGVAVLGPLDHQRHAPCRQRRERVPFTPVAQRDPGDAMWQKQKNNRSISSIGRGVSLTCERLRYLSSALDEQPLSRVWRSAIKRNDPYRPHLNRHFDG